MHWLHFNNKTYCARWTREICSASTTISTWRIIYSACSTNSTQCIIGITCWWLYKIY